MLEVPSALARTASRPLVATVAVPSELPFTTHMRLLASSTATQRGCQWLVV
ncbi:hypothetical protein D3C72_783340 [compost metagenome]